MVCRALTAGDLCRGSESRRPLGGNGNPADALYRPRVGRKAFTDCSNQEITLPGNPSLAGAASDRKTGHTLAARLRGCRTRPFRLITPGTERGGYAGCGRCRRANGASVAIE